MFNLSSKIFFNCHRKYCDGLGDILLLNQIKFRFFPSIFIYIYIWFFILEISWAHPPVTPGPGEGGAAVVAMMLGFPHGGLFTAFWALLMNENKLAWHCREMAPFVALGLVITTSNCNMKHKIYQHWKKTQGNVVVGHLYMHISRVWSTTSK